MKKSILSILLVFLLFLSACSETAPLDQSQPSQDLKDPVFAPSESIDPEPSASEPEPEADDSLGKGVYKTGDYIAAGKYTITCTEADYELKIVVFESSDAYDQYKNTKRITNGEELAAIELYALSDFYLKPDEVGFISLTEGSVLLLDEGRGKLEEYSGENCYPGVYFVGNDLEEGQYEFVCSSTQYGMNFIVFDTQQAYSDYHQTSRFTVGEETDAVEQFASTDEYLREGDTYSVFLSNDSVLLLKGGSGTLSKKD